MESNTILQSLECPFTWGMDDIDLTLEINYNPEKNYQFFPIAQLIYNIMGVYVSTKRKEAEESILTKLAKCEKDITSVRQEPHPEISLAVAEHVLKAVYAHVYAELGKQEELKQTLSGFDQMKFDSKIDKSTLFACKSIIWSKYDVRKAIKFMREAVELNPLCDCWYFILGKELRRVRRDTNIESKISEEEKLCFEKSYSISENQLCGVFVAQMYREDGEREISLWLYDKIYESNPDKSIILLRLALGFIRFGNFMRARICLDKASLVCPKHELYLHYKGIYLMKTKQYRDALPFLEKAITNKNLAVEKDYVKCKTKVDRHFDTTKYLLQMFDKYSQFPKHDIQYLTLELSLSYWKCKNDIVKALEEFSNAVKLNPESNLLKKFHTCISVNLEDSNIYSLLRNTFLPEIRKRYRFNKNLQDKIHDLEALVNMYI